MIFTSLRSWLRRRTFVQWFGLVIALLLLAWPLWLLAMGPLRGLWDWRVVCLSPIRVPAVMELGHFIVRQSKLGEPRYLLCLIPSSRVEEIEAFYACGPEAVQGRLPGTARDREVVPLPPLVLVDCRAGTAEVVPWEVWSLAQGAPRWRETDDEIMYAIERPPGWGKAEDQGQWFKDRLLPPLGEHYRGAFVRRGLNVVGCFSVNGPRNYLRGGLGIGIAPPLDPWYMGDRFIEWRRMDTGERVGKGFKLSGTAQFLPSFAGGEVCTPDGEFYVTQHSGYMWAVPIPHVSK